MSELIDRILDEFKDINYAYNDCTKFDTMKSMLNDVVTVRHGEWIWLSSTYDRIPCEMRYRCSVCRHEEITHYGKEPWHNYCPNCGAKMDGGKNDRS